MKLEMLGKYLQMPSIIRYLHAVIPVERRQIGGGKY